MEAQGVGLLGHLESGVDVEVVGSGTATHQGERATAASVHHHDGLRGRAWSRHEGFGGPAGRGDGGRGTGGVLEPARAAPRRRCRPTSWRCATREWSGRVAARERNPGAVVELAGCSHTMERADAGAEVRDGLGAAGGLHRDCQVEVLGVVHGNVEIDVTPGEGGSGECSSTQGTPAGSPVWKMAQLMVDTWKR